MQTPCRKRVEEGKEEVYAYAKWGVMLLMSDRIHTLRTSITGDEGRPK